MKSILDKTREERLELGQFFTKSREVEFMTSLIRNGSKILEPAVGDGAFLSALGDAKVVHCLELDATIAPPCATITDFFDFSMDNKYDTIIGNPPYVASSLISKSTKEKLQNLELDSLSGKTNLFVYFIEKCLNHLAPGGELIFIVPSNFLMAKSCAQINTRMYNEGSITDFVDYGNESPFGTDAHPEHGTCIFRYQHNAENKNTNLYELRYRGDNTPGLITLVNQKQYYVHDGISYFVEADFDAANVVSMSKFFTVKVGAVSGLDEFFTTVYGNKDFVCSKTRQTGETRRMVYEDKPTPYLAANVDILVARKIKKVWTEHNWWQWGRPQSPMQGKRVYVNSKTRVENPFFCHECENYDGSILAIFLKDDNMKEEKVRDMLNSLDWSSRLMKVGTRYMFKQRPLENCFLSKEDIEKCY